jgi:ribonuclease BN (tRNA processing enzyme)
MSQGFTFIPLGVGDAFTARYFSTSVALHADGQWLLVDCPHPIRRMMRDAGNKAGVPLDVDRFAGVLLTHLHADHCSGVEGLAFFNYFHCGRRTTVLAHPAVLGQLWPRRLAGGMQAPVETCGAPHVADFDTFFEGIALADAGATEFGPFSIEWRQTIHPIPTTALRIHAAGRTLGVSGDTAWDPELIAWLAEADTIIHETNHAIHTPYHKLAALPAEVRDRMRLIHYPDDFDVAASVIEPLAEGQRYTV